MQVAGACLCAAERLLTQRARRKRGKTSKHMWDVFHESGSRSLDAEQANDARHIRSGSVLERALIFLLELLAQIVCGDVARFAIGKVAAGFLGELHEPRVRQANDGSAAVHQKLRIHGVAMTRRYTVPEMGKPAVIGEAGKTRGNIEFPDE